LEREQAFSSQTGEIKKHAYYQNYCVDSNRILNSDKDHQMPFAGGPNTQHKSKMADSRHLEKKSKNRNISATV